jgi:acylpyruvate hydrolase
MKIFCIGRNYAEHAKELNNPIPKKPLVFMKPVTALLRKSKPFYYPEFTKDLHYEAEIVLKINGNVKHVEEKFAHKYYDLISIGIDFTARDVQDECKKKGHPWEIAKAFDGSAPIGEFIELESLKDSNAVNFQLLKNGKIVQDGSTKDMIFHFDRLISYLSTIFMLSTGDLIYTGTPAGVGPVKIGDVLEGFIEGKKLLHCEVR